MILEPNFKLMCSIRYSALILEFGAYSYSLNEHAQLSTLTNTRLIVGEYSEGSGETVYLHMLL